ncbi:MAG: hypothetical protein ABIX01_01030 [Chitinophagaceae bacterium]
MERIITLALVLRKLDNLIPVLHGKKYFADRDNAHAYVEAIVDFIQSIPQQRHRPTKDTKYGAWYAEYKPSRHTSWFVTFDKKGERYIIRNLINNHTKDYPEFIRG